LPERLPAIRERRHFFFPPLSVFLRPPCPAADFILLLTGNAIFLLNAQPLSFNFEDILNCFNHNGRNNQNAQNERHHD
jgi:hypothetical protein